MIFFFFLICLGYFLMNLCLGYIHEDYLTKIVIKQWPKWTAYFLGKIFIYWVQLTKRHKRRAPWSLFIHFQQFRIIYTIHLTSHNNYLSFDKAIHKGHVIISDASRRFDTQINLSDLIINVDVIVLITDLAAKN